MDERNRWIMLIKELRAEHDASILDAERVALSDPHWPRWVEHQINADAKCRRMAMRHIRYNGSNALIENQDGRLKVG